MPDDCIFCKIAQGAIPSHKIYEDADTLAFLDVRPLTRGHALVIPKQHAVRYENLTPQQAQQLMGVAHKILAPLTRAVQAPASTLAINNGKEGGQEVPHVHVHLIPRAEGDGGGPIHALFAKPSPASGEELAALAAQVRAGVLSAAR